VAPDLPGFGRSGKPADFDYSIAGYARFLEAFTHELAWERFSLVVHDWGAVGLALPDAVLRRLARLVIVNAVPLLPGYRWHRVARLWRTPVVGEMTMGFTTRWGMRRAIREAIADREASDALADQVWAYFDHGTQRAILKLYRSAGPDALAHAGARLGELRCPALVAWGTDDPYIPASFGEAYTEALGGTARLELLDGAGHWPWLERPDTIELVARFLERA
jgi:pimeloyl-ACP methyl ester carboxylesterase